MQGMFAAAVFGNSWPLQTKGTPSRSKRDLAPALSVMRALGWSPVYAEAIIRAARPRVGIRYKVDADFAIGHLGYS
jgi:hypothetical protein